ncbi:MAG: cysteine--tRNA ligase [Candidatus Wallbacteria bacterium]|nr:cysteine--tRNA ligase [Candidatus Wallbacteria bacterium]
MKISFKNTYSGQIEEFLPVKQGEVGMYTCGPTVYNYAHIGNFRTYIFEDLLRRFLISAGFSVTQVMNITDIEDKIIRDSVAQGKSLQEFTEFYTRGFFEDMKFLNIESAEHYPRATAHVREMIEMIEILKSKGFTYEKDGSTYFRISDFKDYGKLSKIDLAGVKTGLRYDTDEYEKDDVRDFVLWKAWKEGEPFWDSPFGKGRPGWHIECSAMSKKYLGETFDIHSGGVDNIFPHHENEIAQSEAASGRKFVRYWLHSEHLIVDNKKMSKSLGNFYTLRDLTDKGFQPLGVRYLLLSAHYRSKLNFTLEGLENAEKTVKRIGEFKQRLMDFHPVEGTSSLDFTRFREGFQNAMADDLNISLALSHFHEFMRTLNDAMNCSSLSNDSRNAALTELQLFDNVLGILKTDKFSIPENILELASKRWQAKTTRNFPEADRLRSEILSLGYRVDDSKEGYKVLPI